jgi:hypothetical protein
MLGDSSVKNWDVSARYIIFLAVFFYGSSIHAQSLNKDPNIQHANQAANIKKGATVGFAGPSVDYTITCMTNAGGNQNNSDRDWFSLIESHSGALQALFDLLLFVVGCIQIVIYLNMRRDSIAKERAFVFVSEIHRPPDAELIGQVGPLQVAPKWENSGSTAAVHVWVQVNIEIRDDDLPENFGFPNRWEPGESKKRHPMFIPPRGSTMGSPRTIPSGIVALVFSGAKKVFIYGWCDYNDVFLSSKRRRTEFCMEMKVTALDIYTGKGTIRFGNYGKYNGIDTSCYCKPMPYVPPFHKT